MGVRLAKRGSRQQGHEVIRAERAVISNASVWDTQRLLPAGAAPDSWRQQAMTTPQTGSFVHLHLGATQLLSTNAMIMHGTKVCPAYTSLQSGICFFRTYQKWRGIVEKAE